MKREEKSAVFNLNFGSIFFAICTVVIIASLVITGATTFTLDKSISIYVATNIISATCFLITNVIAGYQVYLFHKKWSTKAFSLEHHQKIYRIFGLIVAILLVALSVFPIYLFERMNPALAFTSTLHRISSRSMFIIMAIECGYVASLAKGQRKIVIPNMLFVSYATLCIIMYLFAADFFWTCDFIFESIYIVGYAITIRSHLHLRSAK